MPCATPDVLRRASIFMAGPPMRAVGMWLVTCAMVLGCARSDGSRPRIFGLALPGTQSHVAGSVAATAVSTSAAPNAAAPGTPGATTPAVPTSTNAQVAARNEQLNQIMAELQSIGALDPAAQAQLIADLQQTDPMLWPQMVQVFRASLKYRQRQLDIAAGRKPAEDKPPVVQLTASAPGATSPNATPAALPTAAAPATATPPTVALTTPPAANAPVATPAAAAVVSAPVAAASQSPATVAQPAVPVAAPAQAVPQIAQTNGIAASPATATSPGSNLKSAANPPEVTPVSFNGPATPENVQEMIAQTIASLEESTAEGGNTPETLAQQTQLRMLYLMAGRRKDAMRPISGLAPAEQDFWVQQMYGMSKYMEAGKGRDRDRRLTDATTHLAQAVDRLSESSNLLVKNLAFCTEVNSFGVHTDFPKNEFKSGQQVLLYCELQNFKSDVTPKGHHTALKSSYQIVDSQGRRVAEHELPITEEHCQVPRHDYFIRYFIHLPTKIYAGKYSLQLTVEDTLANKAGQSSIDFSIKGE